MRVLFCGSGGFALPSLEKIDNSGHDIVSVITQPARKAGRGGRLRPTQVADLGRKLAIEIIETPDINAPDIVEIVGGLRPDVIFVVDFGQKVLSQIRDIARLGAFNLHGSLLPELRGAAPVNWAIIQGLETTGVTTFSLVDKMDAGDIYLQELALIDPNETADELKARLAIIGAELAEKTLGELAGGGLNPTVQDESKVTHARRMTKADGFVNFGDSADSIRRLIHGTYPWPGARVVFAPSGRDTLPVVLARATVAPGPALGAPGIVDDELCVSTGDGRVEILQIKPAGKRLMSWRDFANGYRIRPGDKFLDSIELSI